MCNSPDAIVYMHNEDLNLYLCQTGMLEGVSKENDSICNSPD